VKLRVNGKPVELDGPTPLVSYLRSLGVDARAVAVEVNERIIERADFEQTTLQEDDVVEIVRMVGGGAADSATDATARDSLANRGGSQLKIDDSLANRADAGVIR
jgi:thiamine biosynthesis protein ThiS